MQHGRALRWLELVQTSLDYAGRAGRPAAFYGLLADIAEMLAHVIHAFAAAHPQGADDRALVDLELELLRIGEGLRKLTA